MIPRNFFIFLLIVSVSCENDRPIVKTPLGTVRGYHKQSWGGRTFSAFEGIPYAKPPVGERRFQPPVPFEPWIGLWDAIFVSQCVQTDMMKLTKIEGAEDCLYLNVYVPRDHPDPQDKLDVIVHIHGGAFIYGSGHSYSNPEYLMDRNVIFVTFNYRLGMFGFLSTEDDVVSGNNGLKDQVLALKWIQKNIASFGGNPRSVTLTGLSSGGASVHLHYMSHMSRGLFTRGFSQSGTALNPWALQEEPLAKAKFLGQAVGCTNTHSQVLVQCLKQRHYRHLITKMPLFFGYLSLPFAPFAPVVEKGSDRFLHKHPYELMYMSQMQDLPWIVSSTVHEGMLPAAYLFKDLKTINDDWVKLAPILLDYNYTLPESKRQTVAESIKQFYFGDEDITADNFPTLVQLFTDRLFLVDIEKAARLQATVKRSPVLYYHFGYPGDHSQNKTVSHGDDAQYIFYNMFHRKQISPNEIKMKDVFLDMLVSFAKNGKPIISDVKWEPTKASKLTYLKIDGFESKDIKVESTDELAPKGFWKSLGFLENEKLFRIRDEL